MFPVVKVCALILIPLLSSIVSAEERIRFNRDVRPILSNNCYFCHGFDPEKREADLRLDTREGALEVIVPGDPAASELVARLHTKDVDDLMPPPDSAYFLTKEEKEVLEQWITEGAEYEEHWAYRKLERPVTPQGEEENVIDAFLKRKWDEENVQPVVPASPRILLRRLSYDLRGLPPTAEEVRAFEADPSPENLAHYREQWLASLEHAEHLALWWLDLVRWADSSGMVSDEPIATGDYRRYVIESFHQNVPFDQFTREQLAGDLLPTHDERALIASGYNRLVKTNCEAGVIEEEALHALKGEHVRAIGTVWLGATTGCAECHDHKYDPITAKDYYALAAFFDDLIEVGVYQPGDRRMPIHYLHSNEEKQKRESELTEKVESLRTALYETKVSPDEQARYEAKLRAKVAQNKKKKNSQRQDFAWLPARLPAVRVLAGEFQETALGRVVEAPPKTLARHVAAEAITGEVTGKQRGYYSEVLLDSENPPELIALQQINGAYGRVGWHPDYFATYYWGPRDHPALRQQQPWLSKKHLVHMGPLPKTGEKVRLVIPEKKVRKLKYSTVGHAWMQVGGKATWGDTGYRVDSALALSNRFAQATYLHWWELPLNRDDRKDFPTLLQKSLAIRSEDRRPIHDQVIQVALQTDQQPELATELLARYRELAFLRRDAREALVSKTATPRQTRLRPRGNFMDDSGPIVQPAVPEFLGKLATTERANRLDLANWLTSVENPLTARVFANRIWHQFFGRGLSETLEDSGNQGALPSHPELLDYLAVEFIESGWDVRHLIRLVLTSEAYALSSVPSPFLAENDPTNRLHARQARNRFTGEEIRDTALQAAGLLQATEEIPLSSFYPHQPEAYWAQSNKIMFGSRYQIWETSKAAHQFQRSLYTFWKRQNPHASLLAFDAPTRQECTAERPSTNTPGQALALLNDTIFMEASVALAKAVAQESTTHEEQIAALYARTLQRSPLPEELEILIQTQRELTQHYTTHPAEIKKLLPQERADAEDAAWVATARIVLNLHEFITRS